MQEQRRGEGAGLARPRLAAAPPANSAFDSLGHGWKEELHLTDSPAFLCFPLLSFPFHHSPQKAGTFRGAMLTCWETRREVWQGQVQGSTSAGGPEAHLQACLQHSSVALLHPR